MPALPFLPKRVLLLQSCVSFTILLELITVLDAADRNGMIVIKLIIEFGVLKFVLKHRFQPWIDSSLTNDNDVLDTGLAYDADGGIDELRLAGNVDGFQETLQLLKGLISEVKIKGEVIDNQINCIRSPLLSNSRLQLFNFLI